MAKHCPPTEDTSFQIASFGGGWFSFRWPDTQRCQNLTVLTSSTATGEWVTPNRQKIHCHLPTHRRSWLMAKMTRSGAMNWAASSKKEGRKQACLEQTLRQADNLKPGWKEAVHDRSHLFKGQTRKANIGSFYSLFFIHQHQERSAAALLEEKKEMDSRQERNGSYLWRIANLSCLQTFPLKAQGWKGGQGGGFSH